MYSRRFADAQREVPADYSGVAYRSGKDGARDDRREEEEKENAGDPETLGEKCFSRRPLYRAPRVPGRKKDEENRKRPHAAGGNGKLSSEDLLLAGLILTLLSDREEGERPDGEMLLILGLLLFMR